MTNWFELSKELNIDNPSKVPDSYRQIPILPNYYIDRKGRIRNYRGRELRNLKKEGLVRLFDGSYWKTYSRRKLVLYTWPEEGFIVYGEYVSYNQIHYKRLPKFPKYAVSRDGHILNLETLKIRTADKYNRFAVNKNGKQYQFSARIVMSDLWDIENFDVRT